MKILSLVPAFLFVIGVGCSENRTKPVSTESDSLSAKIRTGFFKDLSMANDMRTILCQNWENLEDAAEAANYSADDEMVFRGFCFFEDGTVAKDARGFYEPGTWSLNDEKKPYSILINVKSAKLQYRLASLNAKEMKLVSANNKIPLVFGGEGFTEKDAMQHPFYPANNSWRLKPAKPESDEEIKKRLKSCIHFFVLFYDHNINGQAKKIDFAGLPTCFRWYAGGIFLQNKKRLSSKWLNCFYNAGDADKAYRLADKLMSKKYQWPKGEKRWLNQNVFVLKQMENTIDSL